MVRIRLPYDPEMRQIEPVHIERAAELRTILGSREAAVSRWSSLSRQPDIVAQAQARQLATLINEADYINAWSRMHVGQTTNIGRPIMQLDSIIAESGLTPWYNNTSHIEQRRAILMFIFPEAMPLLTLMGAILCNVDGAGVIGYTKALKAPKSSNSGAQYQVVMQYTDAPNVSKFNNGAQDANTYLWWYDAKEKQVVFSYCNKRTTMNAAVYCVYAAAIIAKTGRIRSCEGIWGNNVESFFTLKEFHQNATTEIVYAVPDVENDPVAGLPYGDYPGIGRTLCFIRLDDFMDVNNVLIRPDSNEFRDIIDTRSYKYMRVFDIARTFRASYNVHAVANTNINGIIAGRDNYAENQGWMCYSNNRVTNNLIVNGDNWFDIV